VVYPSIFVNPNGGTITERAVDMHDTLQGPNNRVTAFVQGFGCFRSL